LPSFPAAIIANENEDEKEDEKEDLMARSGIDNGSDSDKLIPV